MYPQNSMRVWRHKKAVLRLGRITWSYWLFRQIRVPYAPYRLWIEPTNRCNLACVMCPNKEFPKSELGMMDLNLYKSLIDQAKGFIHDVNLHHRGESTLHPNLIDMIRYADVRCVKTKLHTNGTMLNETLAEELIRSGLRLISFSFDGYTPEVYERIRVRGDYQRTLSRIHRFLEMKQALGCENPRTVLEVMDFGNGSEDSSAKRHFIQGLKSRGLDRFITKKPHNWAGNADIQTVDSSSFSPCTFPWHALVVLWDGRVGSCPHDFFAKIVYGDAKEQSLRDIFNSEGIQALRLQMLRGTLEALESPCRECDSVRRKRLLGIPVATLKYLRD